ncbi:MAG TPA: hypothetical protein VE152_05915, partial [Acidimicrobiales bacterium]|nr:hypothetical protein [Acidimicrobiales bacterium]
MSRFPTRPRQGTEEGRAHAGGLADQGSSVRSEESPLDAGAVSAGPDGPGKDPGPGLSGPGTRGGPLAESPGLDVVASSVQGWWDRCSSPCGAVPACLAVDFLAAAFLALDWEAVDFLALD